MPKYVNTETVIEKDRGTIYIDKHYYELNEAVASALYRKACKQAKRLANDTGRTVEIYSGDVLVEAVNPD